MEVPTNNKETKLKGRLLHWLSEWWCRFVLHRAALFKLLKKASAFCSTTTLGFFLKCDLFFSCMFLINLLLICWDCFFFPFSFFFCIPWIWRIKRLKKKVKFMKALTCSRSAVNLGEGIDGFKATFQDSLFLCLLGLSEILTEGSLKIARYRKSGQYVCVGQVTWNYRFWCLLNKHEIVFLDD